MIRHYSFSQFLVELQREMGRQAYLDALKKSHGRFSTESGLSPRQFIDVLTTSCGWRLPEGVNERLENIYIRDPYKAAESTAMYVILLEAF